MKFSEMLDEYLELRERGPDESSGYTDKAYYRRMETLRDEMDAVIPKQDIPKQDIPKQDILKDELV